MIQQARALYLRRALILALTSALVLTATARTCRAQGDADGDDNAGSAKPTASLNLTFDNRGNAKVYLSLDQTPSDWQPIQAALAQSLHCRPRPSAPFRLQFLPQLRPHEAGATGEIPKVSRGRPSSGSFRAVASLLSANGWIMDGALPLQTLAESLSAAGEQLLFVSAQVPKSTFEEQSDQALEANHEGGPRNPSVFLRIAILSEQSLRFRRYASLMAIAIRICCGNGRVRGIFCCCRFY